MNGENNDTQGNEGGGNQQGNDSNEPTVIPEQSPFTNPGQITTRTRKPIKRPAIPISDD